MEVNGPVVELRPVDAGSWRVVAGLTVAPGQERFVAAPTYYLALCAYGDVWHPMSVHDCDAGDAVVGFLMWGVDEADGSCWLGGILVDLAHQGRGVGRAAVVEAMRMLREQAGSAGFALSYQPENTAARGLYASLGFLETGEVDDDEVVARLAPT
ncbi:MAG TPA: GNAT family N-acetyltransferase [Ornithinibacter sp.]|nr:GNAT family N-acetyltransferase [Ornithinibacter sp.]